MSDRRRAATVRASVANVEVSPGPLVEHYAIPLDKPRLYRFAVGNTSTADSEVVLSHSGGGNGRWLEVVDDDRGADLADEDMSVGVGGGRRRVMPAGTLSTNRTITLTTTNARAGHCLVITRLDSTANTLAVVNGGAGGGTLCTLPVSQRWWVRVQFDGVDWVLLEGGQLPS